MRTRIHQPLQVLSKIRLQLDFKTQLRWAHRVVVEDVVWIRSSSYCFLRSKLKRLQSVAREAVGRFTQLHAAMLLHVSVLNWYKLSKRSVCPSDQVMLHSFHCLLPHWQAFLFGDQALPFEGVCDLSCDQDASSMVPVSSLRLNRLMDLYVQLQQLQQCVS